MQDTQSFQRTLGHIQKPQLRLAGCLFHRPGTRYETSNMKPKLHITISTLSHEPYSGGLRNTQMKVNGTSKHTFRRRFRSKTVGKVCITAPHTISNRGLLAIYLLSDETRLDPLSQSQCCILREQGTRTDAENIQERGERTGLKLHVFAFANWWRKSELYFYKDEEEHVERPCRPPKP